MRIVSLFCFSLLAETPTPVPGCTDGRRWPRKRNYTRALCKRCVGKGYSLHRAPGSTHTAAYRVRLAVVVRMDPASRNCPPPAQSACPRTVASVRGSQHFRSLHIAHSETGSM
uniref:Putative secreted protein n=1 Tax=Anopheles marajoara TaxID=58244 RepID=A0A2M4C7N1_9DIPT